MNIRSMEIFLDDKTKYKICNGIVSKDAEHIVYYKFDERQEIIRTNLNNLKKIVEKYSGMKIVEKKFQEQINGTTQIVLRYAVEVNYLELNKNPWKIELTFLRVLFLVIYLLLILYLFVYNKN